MADIVQLKENGVLKYLKTHFKAVEGLDEELAKKQDAVFKQVTGVPGLNGWYAYNNTGILVTREGRLINITCQLNAGVQTSGTEMLTLPSWAIPQVGGTTLTAMSISKDWAYKPCTVVVRENKLITGANVDNFLTIISASYIAKEGEV